MSLTSHLDDKNSPVRQFFDDVFPDRSYLFSQIREASSGSCTVLPSHKQEALVGTAFDYRLRYFFEVTPSRETVAYVGANVASRHPLLRKDERLDPHVVERLFDYIDSTVTGINPVGRMLDSPDDLVLGRCCVLLAYFERIGRNPDVVLSSPLLNPTPITDVNRIFRIISRDVLADLRLLSELFYTTQRELIASPGTMVLNPTFGGSIDIGGADADLIVDGLLIDIKSIAKPGGRFKDIYQLAGYCLLDYRDEYKITDVGIYFARQGVLVSWPLEKFFSLLSPEKFDLTSLRKQFRKLLLRISCTDFDDDICD